MWGLENYAIEFISDLAVTAPIQYGSSICKHEPVPHVLYNMNALRARAHNILLVGYYALLT